MELRAGLLIACLIIPSVSQAQNACSRGQQWTVTSRPLLSIGEVEGAPEYLLSHVTGAHTLAGRSIVVSSSNPPSIRYYSDQGRFLRSVGRAGGGPGEFRSLVSLIRVAGDSLITHDLTGRRISVFTPQGTFARIVQPDLSSLRDVLRIHFLGGSTILVVAALPMRLGVGRDSLAVFTHDLTTNRGTHVGTFAGMDSHTEPGQTARGVRIHMVPFSRGLASAAGSGHLFLADTERNLIRVYRSSGQLLREFGSGRSGERVTAKDQRDYPRRDLVAAFPNNKPFLGEFHVDERGNLWAAHYQPRHAHAPRVWDIYTASGNRVCTAVTPANHTIFEIGSDYILARSTDDLGVERVVKLALRK